MHQSSTDLMLLQGDWVAVKQWKLSSMQKRQQVIEASTSQEVEDEVEMVQEMDAVEDIEYDLVEDAEEDTKAILTVKRMIQMTYLIR